MSEITFARRRRLAIATCFAAVAVGLVPIGPEATSPDAPSIAGGLRAFVRATVPPADADLDGDGIVATRTAAGAADRTVIELAGAPEMAIIHDVAAGSEFAVRSRNEGVWSGWIEVDADDEDRPDGRPGTEGALDTGRGIGPIWLGHGADRLEIVRHRGRRAAIDVELLEVVDTPSVAELDPSERRHEVRAAATSDPFIRSRSTWATSAMGWPASCGSGPTDNGSIRALVVHHTAGTNSYSATDVPGVLRGIWYYHAQSRGWCDIAYNFLVDRFGRIWEGRQGGITKAIVGGHTFGFNTDTSGIAQLGNFDTGAPPSAMTAATQRLIGWKAGVHDVDPTERTVLTNRASTTAKNGTPSGGTIEVPTVIGHRNLGSTSCPGANTYDRLSGMRTNAFTGAHVYAMYEALVRSGPSPDAYEHWEYVARTQGAVAAADQIAHSDAYAGVAINDLYRLILDRDADPQGRANWLRYVAAGNRLDKVATRFFASDEYFGKQLESNALYVESLYEKILGRRGDPNGLLNWTLALERGTKTRQQVAAGFYGSAESRQQRVARLYREILHRGVDPTGLKTWSAKLQTHDDLVLATFLVSSAEFRNRFV